MKKKIVSLVLALMLCLSCALPASAAGRGKFTDVPDNAWYAKAVNALADGGILAGRGNGKFDPNANVTLAELSVVLMRLHGYEDEIANEDHWAGGAMQRCGLGYDYDPVSYDVVYPYANKPAYRGDAVSALGEQAFWEYYVDYANAHPYVSDVYGATEAYAAKYNLRGIADRSAYYSLASTELEEDEDYIIHYYSEKGHFICAEYIDKAYQFGVITGIDKNHTCNATGTLTRAELAQMCYNMGWTTAGCLSY